MNIVLSTLNSKYIHSNLAIRCLKSYSEDRYPSIKIREFTINDQIDRILGELYAEKPDILGMSCYIFNISPTLLVVDTLKQILPNCIIILGGPEVSFDGDSTMLRHKSIDYIVSGEGEETFKELLDAIEGRVSIGSVKGIYYRDNGQIIRNDPRSFIKSLDSIPFPYKEGFDDLDNKIIYYETSRGCPFSCQYCLSSTIDGVRFLSMDRIKRELKTFIDNGVPQVKLVDRTFNCNPKRAKEIFKIIIQLGGNTNFHFEMAGDLIDEEMLDIISDAPQGLFQFEIGVQSTSQNTLHEVNRKSDLDKVFNAVKRLRSFRNAHIHLDLIAGLPGEDYKSFKKSFNDVYELKPDNLQLGFLKLLKGSGLRLNAEKYGFLYREYPPYEVLSSDCMGYNDLQNLKMIEELVQNYYNSHRFDNALQFLIKYHADSPFHFFECLMEYWLEKGYFQISHSVLRLYDILMEYTDKRCDVPKDLFRDILKFDFCMMQKPNKYPSLLKANVYDRFKGSISEFLKNEDNIAKYLPHLISCSYKQILRQVHIEIFNYNIAEGMVTGEYLSEKTAVLFDYNVNNKSLQSCRYNVIDI